MSFLWGTSWRNRILDKLFAPTEESDKTRRAADIAMQKHNAMCDRNSGDIEWDVGDVKPKKSNPFTRGE